MNQWGGGRDCKENQVNTPLTKNRKDPFQMYNDFNLKLGYGFGKHGLRKMIALVFHRLTHRTCRNNLLNP
uniref:Uncharacterized protein n=1 Tax=Romanomermis culicivorax TaxID=13658 RepID=A0A915JED8_ROMCU